jgi:NAD(P)-dependent dehydrogenase (short-subunit alcohol dehydrogenase family)
MLITGGSRGIGAATARLAAQRGYPVALLYQSRTAEAEALTREIQAAGGRAMCVQADVCDERSLAAAFAAVDSFGLLEVLVNNAGITGNAGMFSALSAQELETVLKVNVYGAMLAAREAIRRLSTRQGGGGGSIINVSSGAAQTGSPGVWVHYAASKGAIDTFTIGLAKELGPEGIRVNAVRPGLINTEIHAGRPPGQLERLASALPLARVGQPEEIANAILWLASAEASYVTAAILDIRGGM